MNRYLGMHTRRIYFYKMTVDDGGAPCCTFGRSGLWSLAICKPMIRGKAQKGDVVIGFASRQLDPSKQYGVVHIAELNESPVSGLEYYAPKSRYAKRDDCIYEIDGADYRRRRGARYHTEDDMDHDLGPAPKRIRARVLVSRNFRFFGRRPPQVDWRRYRALRKRLETLRQGHRVYHAERLCEELETLAAALFRRPFVRNPPHHRSASCSADDDDTSGVCGDCPRAGQ